MPMVYSLSRATAGVETTSATPLTEVDAFFVKAGVRNCMLKRVDMGGRAAALTAISGIVMRIIKWTTASTAGTGITPTPKDPGMQASKCTAASDPSSGTTRVNRFIVNCSASGPGNWFALDQDHVELLEGGGGLSLDGMTASGTASMLFEWSLEVSE